MARVLPWDAWPGGPPCPWNRGRWTPWRTTRPPEAGDRANEVGHRSSSPTNARALTIYLDGGDDPDLAEDGTPLLDHDFLVLGKGWWEQLAFRVPDIGAARTWRTELDT